MSIWPTVKLKELCERVTVGYVGAMAEQYVISGVPFLRSLNIRPYRISLDKLMFIDETFDQKIRKSALHPGDVAIVRTGYPGVACVIPASLPRSNCSDLVIMRPSKNLNPHFLCAIFNSTFGRDVVAGNLVGAAQQHFNITVAKELKFQIPAKPEQDKIAAVLVAYDDLIENNRRRIALLERTAEQLYREWFVRLRFPGYKQLKSAKGIPSNWRVAKLSELAHVNAVSIKKGREPESICYLDIGAVTTNTVEIPAPTVYGNAPGRARRCVKHGDVIWSSVRPANRAYSLILNPPENLIASTGFAVISHRRDTPFSFIKFAVTSDAFVEQMTVVAKGSAYPATSFGDFENAKLLLPTPGLLSEFDRLALPMLTLAHKLAKQNEALGSARDLLLPRLISGKLRVDDLDIQFPPSMQVEGA